MSGSNGTRSAEEPPRTLRTMQTSPGAAQPHAFLSYVREDAETVDRIQAILEAAGVRVWRDSQDLWPGDDWRLRIREAIQREALVFVACFSEASGKRKRSYQNEELHLAIEELRLRSSDQAWLIPVRLDDTPLPAFQVGPGRGLDALQYVDLFDDRWDTGAARLVAAVLRVLQSRSAGPSDMPARGSTDSAPTPLEAPSRAAVPIGEADTRPPGEVRPDYLNPTSFLSWRRDDGATLEFRSVVATTDVQTDTLTTATRRQFLDFIAHTKWSSLLQAWEQKWNPGTPATYWNLEGSNDQWTATTIWRSQHSPSQAKATLALPRPSPHTHEGILVIMEQRVRILTSVESKQPEVGERVTLTDVYWVLDALLASGQQFADSRLPAALVHGDAWDVKLPAASLTAHRGEVSIGLPDLVRVDQERFDDRQPLKSHVNFRGGVPVNRLHEQELRHDLIVGWLTTMLTNMHYREPEELTKDLP